MADDMTEARPDHMFWVLTPFCLLLLCVYHEKHVMIDPGGKEIEPLINVWDAMDIEKKKKRLFIFYYS